MTAATMAVEGRRRAGRFAGAARRRMATGLFRTRTATVASAGRLGRSLQAARKNISARAAAFSTAVVEQRHGTWLVLFGLVFTALWLVAGWIGMANGPWRGLLVGIATPLIVNGLFPLKRSR